VRSIYCDESSNMHAVKKIFLEKKKGAMAGLPTN